MRVRNFSDVDLIYRTCGQEIVLAKNDITLVDNNIVTEEELIATFGSYIRILPKLERPADATNIVDEITKEEAIKKAEEVISKAKEVKEEVKTETKEEVKKEVKTETKEEVKKEVKIKTTVKSGKPGKKSNKK